MQSRVRVSFLSAIPFDEVSIVVSVLDRSVLIFSTVHIDEDLLSRRVARDRATQRTRVI